MSLLSFPSFSSLSRVYGITDGFDIDSLTLYHLAFGNFTFKPAALSIVILVATADLPLKNWLRHPYYLIAAVVVLLVLADIVYGRRRMKRKRQLQEAERIEKEKWLRKVRDEEDESILRQRMK